jgi:hypothetical protein
MVGEAVLVLVMGNVVQAFLARSAKAFVLNRVKPYLSSILKGDCIDTLTLEAGVLHLR